MIYDEAFGLVGSIRNRYLRHCHEINVGGDKLFLGSVGYDTILEYSTSPPSGSPPGTASTTGASSARGRCRCTPKARRNSPTCPRTTRIRGSAAASAHIGGDLIVQGSSPATINVFGWDPPRLVKSVNITMDVRNSVHGLEVWPFATILDAPAPARRQCAPA